MNEQNNQSGGIDWLKLLMPGAGSLLGGLSKLFRGQTEDEQYTSWLRNFLKGELAKAPTQPNLQAYLGQVQGATKPFVNQTAQNASKRLGLDSGAAWQEILKAQSAPLASAGAKYLEDFNMTGGYRGNLIDFMTRLLRR